MDNKCNLSTCRYNDNGICQNKEKWKECIEVSKLVLCLGDKKMKFIDITDKVKHIGKNTPETIEISTITDEPIIIANDEQDRKDLEDIFYEQE